MSDQVVEIEMRYDEACIKYKQLHSNICEIDFTRIPQRIDGPIYVYYELDEFY